MKKCIFTVFTLISSQVIAVESAVGLDELSGVVQVSEQEARLLSGEQANPFDIATKMDSPTYQLVSCKIVIDMNGKKIAFVLPDSYCQSY